MLRLGNPSTTEKDLFLKELLPGLRSLLTEKGIPHRFNRTGSMFCLFFTDREIVSSYAEATNCDVEKFRRFFHAMLEQGVYLAPSAYEAGFVSSAHTDEVIDQSIARAGRAYVADLPQMAAAHGSGQGSPTVVGIGQ